MLERFISWLHLEGFLIEMIGLCHTSIWERKRSTVLRGKRGIYTSGGDATGKLSLFYRDLLYLQLHFL